jgi:hypothetical protein
MSINQDNVQDPSEHDDTIGENAGDSELSKEATPNVQNKPDEVRVDTVTPGNDNGTPETPSEDSSNKGQGPANENL